MNKVGGALLVVAALGISAFRVMRSYDNATTGQSVRSDAQQMAEAGEDPEAIGKLNPQSEVGKEVKPLLLKITDCNAKLERDLAAHSMDEIFTAEHLADPKLRKQSLAHIDAQQKAYTEYVEKVKGYRAEILAANLRHGYQKRGAFEDANGEDLKILRCQRDLLDHYRKIIRFAEDRKIGRNGSKLTFASQEDIKAYGRLMDKGMELEEMIEATAKKVVQDKNERNSAYVAQVNGGY